MALPQETLKTIADIDALPEGTKAELIDGRLFFDTAPTLTHQDIVGFLHGTIWSYIRVKGGKCKVFISPIDVQLNADDIYNLVQPDVAVVCDRDKLSDGKRCKGAPDWIMEVVSPSTENRDYIRKLGKYNAAGVREYWIVDPNYDRVVVCDAPAHVLTNGRGFLRHGGTPQRTFTSPLHPVTGLPLSRLLGGFLF